MGTRAVRMEILIPYNQPAQSAFDSPITSVICQNLDFFHVHSAIYTLSPRGYRDVPNLFSATVIVIPLLQNMTGSIHRVLRG